MEYMEQAMQQQIEYAISEAERCYDEIAQLKAERDALSAQVEALKREFKDARATLQTIAGCTWDSGAGEIADIALDESKRWVSRYDDSVLNKTPQQCLRDVQAEAGRLGFIAGCHCGANYNIHDWDNQADEYADSIRKEKK